jgi:hypothetical protein
MPHVSERRRKPRRKTAPEESAIWAILENVTGTSAELRVKVVDAGETGLGVEMPEAIAENTIVLVKGEAGGSLPTGKVRARVVRCTALPGGGYQAGLAYERGRESDRKAEAVDPVADYYEVMQVNPKADPETIHRVYRILAQRFHPDNAETGNAEVFRGILDAYKVLSDPENRAAYDVHLQAYRHLRWRIFDQGEAGVGKRAEVSKRRGLLELLYAARMNQPSQPTMSLHELEDLLGCPREHLEFSLWYLKENALVVRADNGRFSITAKGVDRAEAQDAVVMPNSRLLPAAG